MLMYLPIIFFIFGLIVGSFLNVLVYRLEDKKRKTLFGRSFCPHCGEKLSWYDMFPVLSWVFLGRKCRKCGVEISIQYPLVELFTGGVFGLVSYFFLYTEGLKLLSIVNIVFWLFFSACLVVIFVYDLKHQIIPNGVIYTAIVASLLYVVLGLALLGSYLYLFDHLLSGVLATVFFLITAFLGEKIFKQMAMGGGDIKLAAFMGFALGWQGLSIALYFSFISSAVFGLALIALGKKKMASRVPFGPFLVTGTFLGLLYGEKIISFYVNMFM